VEISNKKITELVDENYIFAYVLYYFGIQFYEYSENTLKQVCVQKGLNVDQVVQSLESISDPAESPYSKVPVDELPVDLVIEYLKHTHHLFIKQKLPYIARLIEKLSPAVTPLAKDLQIVFPLFVEDFIYHIYEEEDTLFTYISLLASARKKKANANKVFLEMEKHSLQKYAMDHDTHDDEMQGIRQITNGYSLEKHSGLHIKVIFSELKAFEQELKLHARIENEILFPKALALEREVRNYLQKIIPMN
jgi:regulator of cell morphogenesis and NO signaling